MKKRTLLVLMAAAFMATSCNNDTEEFEISSQNDVYSTFVAGNPGIGDATRSEVNYEGDKVDPWWSVRDRLFFCQELENQTEGRTFTWRQSKNITTSAKYARFAIANIPNNLKEPTLDKMMDNIIKGKDLWSCAFVSPSNTIGGKFAENKRYFPLKNSSNNFTVIPGGGINKIPTGSKLYNDFLIAKPLVNENIKAVDLDRKSFTVELQFKRITSYLRLQFEGFADGTKFKSINLSTKSSDYNFKGKFVLDMATNDVTFADYGPMVLTGSLNAADGYLIPIMPGNLKAGSKLYVELVDQNGAKYNKEININNEVFLQSGVITTFNITKP